MGRKPAFGYTRALKVSLNVANWAVGTLPDMLLGGALERIFAFLGCFTPLGEGITALRHVSKQLFGVSAGFLKGETGL